MAGTWRPGPAPTPRVLTAAARGGAGGHSCGPGAPPALPRAERALQLARGRAPPLFFFRRWLGSFAGAQPGLVGRFAHGLRGSPSCPPAGAFGKANFRAKKQNTPGSRNCRGSQPPAESLYYPDPGAGGRAPSAQRGESLPARGRAESAGPAKALPAARRMPLSRRFPAPGLRRVDANKAPGALGAGPGAARGARGGRAGSASALGGAGLRAPSARGERGRRSPAPGERGGAAASSAAAMRQQPAEPGPGQSADGQ